MSLESPVFRGPRETHGVLQLTSGGGARSLEVSGGVAQRSASPSPGAPFLATAGQFSSAGPFRLAADDGLSPLQGRAEQTAPPLRHMGRALRLSNGKGTETQLVCGEEEGGAPGRCATAALRYWQCCFLTVCQFTELHVNVLTVFHMSVIAHSSCGFQNLAHNVVLDVSVPDRHDPTNNSPPKKY